MHSTGLALWIAEITHDSRRQAALRGGSELTELAVSEKRIPAGGDGAEELAQAFVAAWSEGWIAFDYSRRPENEEPPQKSAFRHEHLKRCENIRIPLDAWPAMPALRAESRQSAGAPAAGGPGRDIFICHASEDKDAVARPLAERLRTAGWKVWYDEFEIRVGASIREKIEEGLLISRFGAVVLSPAFFQRKHWTELELDGLLTREAAEGRTEEVILPIWHNVTRDDVAGYSPWLAGRRAAKMKDGLDVVVEQLEAVLHGEEAPAPTPGRPNATPSLRLRAIAAIATLAVGLTVGLTSPWSRSEEAQGSPRYAKKVGAVFDVVNDVQPPTLQRLARANRPATQAAAASRLSRVFSGAASTLRKLEADPGDARMQKLIVERLAAVSDAYAKLGNATTDPAGSEAELDAALSRTRTATRQLRAAQRKLADHGYRIEAPHGGSGS